MEKVIYLLWRDPATAQPPATLTAALRNAGARSVRLNLADADVAKAVGLKQVLLKPQPDALAQVWVDSAIAARRKAVDAVIARACTRYAAYLVTESQPIVNTRHPATAGQRTFGFAQVALLRRPAT